MSIRYGRAMKAILESILDLQSRPEVISSIYIDLFAHKYRKALREMRQVRQVTQIREFHARYRLQTGQIPAGNPVTLAAIQAAKDEKVSCVPLNEL